MYLPPHFAVTDPEALHQLMQAHPLGALITCGEGGWMPTTCRSSSMGAGGHGVLRAHVARNNPLAGGERRRRGAGDLPRRRGLYLPSWYPGKQVHHQQVPTWNYAVVHAHGRIRVRDDARFVRRLLATLTRTHEAGVHSLEDGGCTERLSRDHGAGRGGHRDRD
jgi:transcriptional regulator